MSTLIIVSLSILIFNIVWFSSVFNYPSQETETIPKFIHSTKEISNIELIDSFFLKSIYLYQSIKKQESKSQKNQEDETSQLQDEQQNVSINEEASKENFLSSKYKLVSNSTKVSMFLSKEKRRINLLSISNLKGGDLPVFDSLTGNIGMQSVNLDDYLIKKERKVFRNCWSMSIPGRIIGAVASPNKKVLAIFYSITEGPKISFRIRVIHDISCEKAEDLINSAADFNQLSLLDYLSPNSDRFAQNETKKVDRQSYFRIGLSASPNTSDDNKTSRNYFNSNSFDDFSIQDSSPIVSMAIKEGFIIYSRSTDFHEFYILSRVESKGEVYWEVKLTGKRIEKENKKFYYSNSFKFMNSVNHDISILQVYISSENDQVFLNSRLIYANMTKAEENDSNSELTLSNPEESLQLNSGEIDYTMITQTDLKELVLNSIGSASKNSESSEVEMKELVALIKQYMKATNYSSNSSPSMIYELFKGYLISLDWNFKTQQYDGFELVSKYKSSSKLADLTRIFNDEDNRNILLKLKGNNMYYINREFEAGENTRNVYEYFQPVNFKHLHKSIRNQEFVNVLFERIDDKMLLFILSSEGDLTVVDFTQSIDSKGAKNWDALSFVHEIDLNLIFLIICYCLLIPVVLRFTSVRSNQIQELSRQNEEYNIVANSFIQSLIQSQSQLNQIQRQPEQNPEEAQANNQNIPNQSSNLLEPDESGPIIENIQ